MERIYSEPKLGRTIHIMMKEYHFLNEFMGLMKQKIKLDMKHTTALKKLKKSWNPKWEESAIWPLISPMLTYLSKEIDQRKEAEGELFDRLYKFPETRSPNEHSEDDFDPLELPSSLEPSYTQYQTCHQNITTAESLAALETWYDNLPDEPYVRNFEEKRSILPEIDQKYRQAVTSHQQNTSKAHKWYSGGLVVALEEHQQRAENIKSLIHDSLRGLNNMASELSVVCSAATNANRSFSSTTYIAPRHHETEREMGHHLLQTVQYRNYMADGDVAWPLGGLEALDSIKVLRMLAGYIDNLQLREEKLNLWLKEPEMASAFDSEKIISANGGLPAIIDKPFPKDAPPLPLGLESLRPAALFKYVCLSTRPLIPLEKHHIDQYRNGIPRGKIHLVLDLIVPEIRLEVLRLMHLFLIKLHAGIGDHASILFAHRSDAGPILRDIWRKWDFEHDLPLPPGVNRDKHGIVTNLSRQALGIPRIS